MTRTILQTKKKKNPIKAIQEKEQTPSHSLTNVNDLDEW